MSGRGNPEPDFPPDARPCDQVTFETVLVDVNLEAAKGVSVDEVFDIELLKERYPAVVTPSGILGSVASGVVSPLVRCLREGAKFEAVIVEIDGAFVRVRIRPK